MKILHIFWSLGFGGIETMLINIANEQSLTNQVTLLIIDDNINQSIISKLSPNVKIQCLHRNKKSSSLFIFLKFNFFVFMNHWDVVHSHQIEIARLILPIRKLNLFATCHTIPKPIVLRWANRYSKIFSISNAVKTALSGLNVDSELVYNGISIESFQTKKSTPLIVSKKVKPFRLVQVGRMEHLHKGQDILIQALSKLPLDFLKSLHLDFIGNGSSMLFLKDLAEQLNVSNQISFLGSKSQEYLFEHLHSYDLFIHPSRFEGFGLTIAEGMAAKIPALVSDLPAPMEIINQGKCGNHFKTGDAEDCAKKILLIIQGKYENEMLERAYQRVQDLYSVEMTAQNYLNEYEKIIK